MSQPGFFAGRHLWGLPQVHLYTLEHAVRAGHFLWVEPDVEMMVGGNHRIDWVTTFPVRQVYDLPGEGCAWSKGDLVIGHGVRLGRGAKVLSGVTIGDGARVEPRSVVVRDVRPYSVVAGNPARQVALRFDTDTTARLVGTSWWDWHDDMTVWRLDRLTGGRAHELVPQLGRDGPRQRRASARRAVSHLLRGVAHRLDVPETRTAWRPAEVSTPPDPIMDPPIAGVHGSTVRPGLPPPTVPMGRGSYGWPTVHGPVDRLVIGNYCSLAPDSMIVVDPGGVRLGSDVWVGRGASILPGVSISDGAVIAAYSVVTADVRPFAVVAGDPAREVKRRFDDSIVASLLRIRWWDWSEETVRERADDLSTEDVAGFIARHAPASHDAGSRTAP